MIVVSRKAQTSMPEGVETTVVKNEPNSKVEVSAVDVDNHYYHAGSDKIKKLSTLELPREIQETLEVGLFHNEKVFLKALKGVLCKEELKKYQDLLLKNAVKSYQEKELYCLSEARAQKEQSMRTRIQTRFEEDLKRLNSGLAQKGRTKNYEKVTEKIGRLKENYKGISSHYDITVTKDEHLKNAFGVTWNQRQEKIKDRFLGVYCLRTSIRTMDTNKLWKTYIMLTEVEAAFRCMKSELGLRPVHHQLEDRVDGHLFITLLAYHLIHCIRFRLKQHKINDSWTTLRDRLSTQVRLTTSMRRKDGKIYEALDVSLRPGKVEKPILYES